MWDGSDVTSPSRSHLPEGGGGGLRRVPVVTVGSALCFTLGSWRVGSVPPTGSERTVVWTEQYKDF